MKIETKENTDKLDFINIKSICNSKNTIMKMKGKLTERAKHFCTSFVKYRPKDFILFDATVNRVVSII